MMIKFVPLCCIDCDDTLIGCIRILSDGYLFGIISEILVLP